MIPPLAEALATSSLSGTLASSLEEEGKRNERSRNTYSEPGTVLGTSYCL